MILLNFKKIQEYCQGFHPQKLMQFTMILFPTIFANLERAYVNHLLTLEEKKKEKEKESISNEYLDLTKNITQLKTRLIKIIE